jgi:4'-phosphopantetheinyl transferase
VISWRGPSHLGETDVVVCAAALEDVPLSFALRLLSAAERARAERFKLPARFAEFVKTRALLRWVLGCCAGCDPRRFEIEDGDGAPRLAGNKAGLHFNVSHSAGQALVAVGRDPLGIDIEHARDDIDGLSIACACYHPQERARVVQAEGAARIETFFEIWTRKEAYLKATGTGLSAELTSFSTVAEDRRVETDDTSHGLWYVQTVAAPLNYKAAIATRCPQPRLHRLKFGVASVPARDAGLPAPVHF